jgi:hypothetical protein
MKRLLDGLPGLRFNESLAFRIRTFRLRSACAFPRSVPLSRLPTQILGLVLEGLTRRSQFRIILLFILFVTGLTPAEQKGGSRHQERN